MYAQPSSPAAAVGPTVQHDGTPLPHDDYYPVAPDGSIGRIFSSSSNKTRSGWKSAVGTEAGTRGGLAVIAFFLGGILALVAVDAGTRSLMSRGIWQPMEYHDSLMVIGGLMGAIVPTVMVLVLFHLFRAERLSWVGENGIQQWEKGIFGVKSTILRFADAYVLTTSRTRQYVNGAYTGTMYNYTWWGNSSNKLLALAGSYREPGVAMISMDKRPPAHDPIAFAEAAERIWSRHKIARIDQEIRQSGVARFVNGQTTLRVGKGFVEIETGGKVERLDRSQIESATVQQGWVVIKRVGAKEGWFSSEGVFRFPVAGMGDFMVFLAILQEQAGIRMV